MGRHAADREQADEPQGADAILSAVAQTPKPVRNLGARALTSDRLFNLIVSNIPGPPIPLFLMGCRATRAYPIVPLDDGHGVSIGITSTAKPASACTRGSSPIQLAGGKDPVDELKSVRGMTSTFGCALRQPACLGGAGLRVAMSGVARGRIRGV